MNDGKNYLKVRVEFRASFIVDKMCLKGNPGL